MTIPAPRLRVHTRTVADPGALLDLLPENVPATQLAAWVRDGEGIVGWGEAARVDTSGEERFAQAERWWADVVAGAEVDDQVRVYGSGLVAFGSFAYAADSTEDSCLIVPQVIVGRREDTWWATTLSEQSPPSDPARNQRADLSAPVQAPRSPGLVVFADGALPGPRWQAAVACAVERITAGDLDKVVLARDLVAETECPIDLRWVLTQLGASYGRTWVFAVDGLVGATPEMLVRLERGLVTSRVLAGTIRRTGDDERDLALAASLARSSKDLEEHEYAVRSVGDALNPYCTSVSVPESPFVLHLPNVMHLATDVAGRLVNGATSLELAASLHPSAAVCGTPKPDADGLIADLEQMDRGRYAGPVGWMDASGDGEWGIALRSGALDREVPTRMRLFAGCGIVAGSDPAAELAESDAKLVPMRSALQG
ncbi:isochorismate synthase [Gephyromycinifex aptenodytis]|uniref:isochorismate synthase n=1 Tax=Gephyromycinifex aptenodytis TaxID=2716227 RepID=UPI0014452276|nr:isochorismate synthase [Gephyromycinifex aptenodytis]